MKSEERLFQKYIQGSLDAGDRAEFEKRIDNDSAFAKAYQQHLDLHNAIRITENERRKSVLENYESKKTEKTSGFCWYQIAAVFIILVGSGSLIYMLNQNSLYDQYYESFPNITQPVVRGGTIENDIDLFYQLYENEEYQEAIDVGLEVKNKTEAMQFYIALCHLELGNKEKALSELENLNSTDDNLRPAVLWYTGLIYLDQDKIAKASERLLRLKSNYPNFMPEEVKEILAQMD